MEKFPPHIQLSPGARGLIEDARHYGRKLSFHVTKVKEYRWNWILTMRYVTVNPESGERLLTKVFLRTSKERDPLEALREYLEAQEGTP